MFLRVLTAQLLMLVAIRAAAEVIPEAEAAAPVEDATTMVLSEEDMASEAGEGEMVDYIEEVDSLQQSAVL